MQVKVNISAIIKISEIDFENIPFLFSTLSTTIIKKIWWTLFEVLRPTNPSVEFPVRVEGVGTNTHTKVVVDTTHPSVQPAGVVVT